MIELHNGFQINAIALYSVPADGPHGFFAFGRLVLPNIMPWTVDRCRLCAKVFH